MSSLTPNLPAETVTAIIAERQRQDQEWITKGLKQSTWMDVLAEEIGEVARARLEKTNLREELLQVASVAVAIIEDALGVSQSDALNLVDARSGGSAGSEQYFLRMLYWMGRAADQAEFLPSGGECSDYISNVAKVGAIAATMHGRLGGAA